MKKIKEHFSSWLLIYIGYVLPMIVSFYAVSSSPNFSIKSKQDCVDAGTAVFVPGTNLVVALNEILNILGSIVLSF